MYQSVHTHVRVYARISCRRVPVCVGGPAYAGVQVCLAGVHASLAVCARVCVGEGSLTCGVFQRVGNGVVRGISGGQKRRLVIGRVLVTHARLAFCDEPTSGIHRLLQVSRLSLAPLLSLSPS